MKLTACPGAAHAGLVGDQQWRNAMNWDQLEGKWKQYKGSVKEKWGKLTDDDLNVIDGRRQMLVGKIQEYYGTARDVAEREADEWLKTLNSTEAAEQVRRARHS
jgi:uncharacterized protein YjbJ (UPF0337 family)